VNRLTDQQLLRDYTGCRSDAAFAELVRRHVDLVYSAALRMVRDAHLAEDVTQNAFVALAQNAGQLTDHPVLSGWLHRTAQNLAANAVRTDVRRRAREEEAVAMNEPLAAEPEAAWEHIAPHLDAALGELSESDRDALLLRYFERKSAREMAQTLGTSEDAAQKRVSRAVERLREFFSKRGVTVGASGLGIVISAHAVQAAPVGLAVAISTTAVLAGAAVSTSTVIAATKAIAMTTIQKTLITATIATAVGAGIYGARQISSLRDENQKLIIEQRQLASERNDAVKRLTSHSTAPAPHLPAPRMQQAAAPAEMPPDNSQSTKQILRLLHSDKTLQLSPGQVESYLKANRRSAASLLAAFRATGDPTLLEEAMQKYPNDPQVAFAAIQKKDASREDRRQWLETFKNSSPDNALANYLAALDCFKAGQTDQAVQELIAASSKQQFQDFSLAFVQDSEDAFRAAGYSEAEAKVIASISLWLPQLGELKQLNQNMIDLAKSYQQAGDEASAQAVLQMDVNLGQRLGDSGGYFLLNQLVGNAIERIALGAMDVTRTYGNTGMTVRERIDQLAQQYTAINELAQQVEGLQQTISAQDWISYLDRSRNFGELAAAQWLISKYGQQ
jgi:RNA polymerase sigma factor (sigma-70 family)